MTITKKIAAYTGSSASGSKTLRRLVQHAWANNAKHQNRFITFSAAALAALALTSCGGSSPKTVKPVPPAYESPRAGEEQYSLLKAEGTLWMNQQNEKVSLRGINIGNWLLLELWMFDNGENPLGADIEDQCTVEQVLSERFGEAEKERLLTLHHDTWFTEADWDVIADAGFNVVRIPFIYSLLEDDANPYTLREDAWKYLDWAIAEARARNIYIILDLHGTVGSQGWEHHSGCAGQNLLWDSEEYQARTAWLWEQIAIKYKNEPAVAGYGLLNEPWGTDSVTLRNVSIDLYNAVRKHDDQHIVILPGHNADGISAYGDPMDFGMQNVAFEAHFYPGIFGWGQIGYEVHRDWLTCGEAGDTGVCDWATRARDVYTPMLIGEMQPWTGLGELGGAITRATFDTYNELNWAGTAWSYKVATPSGGLGNGTWGYVTNNGDQLLAKAQTWGCAGWESTLASACDVSARSTTPYEGEGTQAMYLVLKTGGFGNVDVVYDSLKLVRDSDGVDILTGGEFGSAAAQHWTEVSLWGDPRTYSFDYAAGEFAGTDSGEALRVYSDGASHSLVYQAVQVEGGQSYTLQGKFHDQGSADTWAEIYLVPEQPQEFVDVTGRSLPTVDLHSSSIESIEQYFSFFGINSMDYVVNHWVKDALNQDAAPAIFTNLPSKPANLLLTVADEISLSWQAATGEVDGYRVYRSTSPRSGFQAIAEVDSLQYIDVQVNAETTYYYYVSAFNSVDEGYGSEVQASGETFYTLPSQIEAENFTAAHPGVEVETSSDEGGGFNIGHFETDRWVEYEIYSATASDYTISFRVASQVGDMKFAVLVADQQVAEITVPNTMGWQTYETVSANISVPEGKNTLRLVSIDNQWNLNWIAIDNLAP